MSSERDPLLGDFDRDEINHHHQFCALTGVSPSDGSSTRKFDTLNEASLYARARAKRRSQNRVYLFTATLTNTMLLSQIVIGAALTALGASQSSPIMVTLLGALNTIIAGLITYLKSRGQPMRARMFRDDLERVVDEIENSGVMCWAYQKIITVMVQLISMTKYRFAVRSLD